MTARKVATPSNTPNLASNFGAATKAVVKAAAGNVFSVHVTNANAALRYLLLHNKATAPAGTDVPLFAFPIPAGSSTQPTTLIVGEDFFGQNGHYFSTGIGFAVSTTGSSFTDSATASDHYVHVEYA